MLALVACAGTVPALPEGGVVFAPLSPSFEAAGRLSVRHGADAVTANFRWQHDGDGDVVDLASPLGQTIARLSGSPGSVTLRTGDGHSFAAADWRELGERSLEWSLPMDGLAFWIQGAPRAGAAFAVEPGPGRGPGVLRQDGWTIVYQSFATDAAGVLRPARMALSYPDVELRLIIDTWK